jgi:hypothetical protein
MRLALGLVGVNKKDVVGEGEKALAAAVAETRGVPFAPIRIFHWAGGQEGESEGGK